MTASGALPLFYQWRKDGVDIPEGTRANLTLANGQTNDGGLYSVFITNADTIDQLIALWEGESTATIPSGRVVKGGVPYNARWSWHIDSEDITMAEATVELCDGTPSYLEWHLDEWIETVGYFCPWAAKLILVVDYR